MNKGLTRGIIVVFLLLIMLPFSIALQDYNKDGKVDIKDFILEKNPMIISGDLNMDGKVDIVDFGIIGENYGYEKKQISFTSSISEAQNNADLNNDGKVDIADIAIVGKNYEKIMPVQNSNSRIFIYPSEVEVYKSENFQVYLNISTDASVYASSVKVYFNQSFVNATSVSEGNFFKKDGASTYPVISINYTGSYVDFANTRFSTQTGVTGNGALAIINFIAIEKGNTTLNIADGQLVDENINSIQGLTTTNGKIAVVTNKPPVIDTYSPLNNPTIYETQTQSFSITKHDPESDPMNVKWYLNGADLGISADSYNYYSDYNSAGSHNVTIIVNDNKGNYKSKEWLMTVTNTNRVPSTPTQNSLIPTDSYKNTDLTCSGTGSIDADGDSVTYYYEFRKSGSVLKSYSTSNQYNCGSGCNKNDDVTCYVKAYDGNDYSSEKASNVVKIKNSAPTTPTTVDLSPTIIYKNSQITCSGTGASDVDGDSLNYYYEFRKSGSVLKSFSTSNTYNCGTNCNKNDNIICYSKVYDGTSYSSETASNSVLVANSAPILGNIGDKTGQENSLLEFSISATDADSDNLVYSADDLPSGASLSNKKFSWTPNFEQEGIYYVTFNVSDGESQDSERIKITISKTNRAPTIDSYSPLSNPTINEGTSQGFTGSASDADGDSVTLTWYVNGNNVGNGNSYTFNTNENSQGVYNVKLTASDGDKTAEKVWTLNVNDNQARVYLKSGTQIFSIPRGDRWTFNSLNSDCEVSIGGGACSGSNLAYKDVDTGDWICLGLNDNLYVGMGYFVKVKNDCSFLVDSTTVKTIGWKGTNKIYNTGIYNHTAVGSFYARTNINNIKGNCAIIGMQKYVKDVTSCAGVSDYNGKAQFCFTSPGTYCYCTTDWINPGEGYLLEVSKTCDLGGIS